MAVSLRVTLVALFLLSLPRLTAALDCQGMLPLPADVRVVPPAPDVPEAIARFSGAWSGAWRDRRDADAQCNVLVVKDVHASGFARVVYSVGVSPTLGTAAAYQTRTTARLVDGTLRFVLPTASRPVLVYRLEGSELTGTFNAGGSASLRRLADLAGLSALRCGGPSRSAVAPSASVRDRLTAAELTGSATPDGPVHTDYFMPVGSPAVARHTLRGIVTFAAGSLAGARSQELQAPRSRELQAPRSQELQAPRSQELQAPRSQELQAPRSQELQAPRSQELQAPRSQELQAPRSQELQAPRSDELSRAATLVSEAEAACQAGNPSLAADKAKAAMGLLKK